MVFFVGDLVKIKKIREESVNYQRYSSFIGQVFKIVNARRYFSAGNGNLYKIRSNIATLNHVPGDILLLKRKGPAHKDAIRNVQRYSGIFRSGGCVPNITQNPFLQPTEVGSNSYIGNAIRYYNRGPSGNWEVVEDD
jgi:hypothetical protein